MHAASQRATPPADNLATSDVALRTFVAESMPAALAQVKQAFGQHAVILGTRSIDRGGLRGLVGKRCVEITAAAAASTAIPALRSAPQMRSDQTTNAVHKPTPRNPLPAPTASARRDRSSSGVTSRLPDHLHPYFVRLVQNEVAEDLAAQLVAQAAAQGGTVEQTLRDYIARMVPVSGGITLANAGCRRFAFVGPAGAGKTTIIAKLAARLALRERRRVALLTLDTQRLAAAEQLRRYAQLLRVPVFQAQTAADVAALAGELAAHDAVLVDTPGVGLRDTARLIELQRTLRAVRADEVHLVAPASLAPAVQGRIAAAFAPLGVSRVVLTRLDEAVGFGSILAAMQKLQWRLSYLSNGQSVPNDLIQACSRQVAELILPVTVNGSPC